MYGLARLREWVSIGLLVPVSRGLRSVRASPVAWSLGTVAGTLTAAVAVSSISRRSLGGDSVVELICAGLAMSVAIAEGSATARMQRAGLRSRQARRGLQRW